MPAGEGSAWLGCAEAMLSGRLRPPPRCGSGALMRAAPVRTAQPAVGRRPLSIVAVGDFFNKFRGGGGDKQQGGGAGNEDAARKALEGAFGGKNQKKFQNFFGQQAPQQPSGGGGEGGKGFGGFGGGGGGGGGFGDAGAGGDSGAEGSILGEIWGAFRAAWTIFWNLALFLVFADVLHRSLDWCCGVELLFLVGAPQQAFERLAGRFFAVIEWFEKNALGWDIPGEEDMIPQYENIRLFYPRAHAYTFDQYRYNLTDKEKQVLTDAYALKALEREGGRPGDVDFADVAAIRAKYDPLEADRQAYLRAKRENRLEEYWAGRKELYERVTGERFVRPPGVAPPPAVPA